MQELSPSPALELRRLTRCFDGRAVLSGIDLAVPAGKITCLLGQSGCGKSTLLRLIAGVDAPDSGALKGSPQALT